VERELKEFKDMMAFLMEPLSLVVLGRIA